MWSFFTANMHGLMFSCVCSTAGRRQKTAARRARVPQSQGETEKNPSVGFRRIKRIQNSLQHGNAEMLD